MVVDNLPNSTGRSAEQPVGRYYRPLVNNRPFCLNGWYSWICGRYYIKIVDILSNLFRMVIWYNSGLESVLLCHYITSSSPAKMSMHFLAAKCAMLQVRAFQITFVVDILVDIMLCGQYLVYFCCGRYLLQPHWPLCIYLGTWKCIILPLNEEIQKYPPTSCLTCISWEIGYVTVLPYWTYALLSRNV